MFSNVLKNLFDFLIRMKLLVAFLLLACTIFTFMQMRPTGKKLYTPETKLGILNLEFAYNTQHTSTILSAWQAHDKIKSAKENTYIDFALLICYSLFLFYSCKNISAIFKGKLRNTAMFLAKASLIAGGLDVLENCGMLVTLSGNQSVIVSLITATCSIIKWGIAVIAVLFLLFLSPYALYLSLKKRSQPL